MENKFRAVRYGLDGKLIDFGKQNEVPERDLILEYLDFVDDVVDELGAATRSSTSTPCWSTDPARTGSCKVSRETGDLRDGCGLHGSETGPGCKPRSVKMRATSA